jgi:pyruvate,orthophosphate dikinase
MSPKYLYFFGGGKADGSTEMKNLLGGKGAGLAEMTNIGIPVPPGFTITTEVCTYYYENGKTYPKGLRQEVERAMKRVEKIMGAKFGDPNNPLLVSVRSGARVSMPGMMETVLNIGLNDETIQGLIARTQNKRFAYDAYRRFIQMYSDVVMEKAEQVGLPDDQKKQGIREQLEHEMDRMKKAKGIELDTELDAEDLKKLCRTFKNKVRESLGREFPERAEDQLWGAIGAVFSSWNGKRAVSYRKINNIPEHWGTAVNVQAMVFGNMGNDSATGVAFTRDPATGERRFFGEWLRNAQGEDVVAGIRTPQPINIAGKRKGEKPLPSLEEEMPQIYNELEGIYENLERHYRDMLDIEFTIQQNRLWMLQTRVGKRTALAAIRIAVEMVKEKLISRAQAVLRVAPEQIDQLLHPMIDPKAEKKVIAKGLPASPGAASGQIVFSADDAEAQGKAGKAVILVRHETSPEDIHGMNAAQAILTAKGGMTSHAAVVARGMGKCCVVGCGAINIDYAQKQFSVNSRVFKEGDSITLDGSTGEVMEGVMPTIKPEMDENFRTLMSWADHFCRLGVWTNADTPKDAKVARDFGAQGIGLCRTEHMFFDESRIAAMREMIIADSREKREKALAKIMPYQKNDFVEIFKVMEGLPVTIRSLDPPLHEFLPQDDEAISELAQSMEVPFDTLKAKVKQLHELNPMLGHRGCRLGITYNEITAMQAQAIFEAAAELTKQGKKILPEVMVPLVGIVEEFEDQKRVIDQVASEVMKKYGVKFTYHVGTMIEVPRAVLVADQIARAAEFFSFGTNDLTQMTFGFSRDDAGTFLPLYIEKGILKDDVFQTLDQEGVGQLVAQGVERGRKANSKLKIGICGEHGGDPRSVEFCHRVGLDYVSCSPYRVPIACLAAAHAAIKDMREKTKARKKPAKPRAVKKKIAKKPKKKLAKKRPTRKAAKKKTRPKKSAAKRPAKRRRTRR